MYSERICPGRALAARGLAVLVAVLVAACGGGGGGGNVGEDITLHADALAIDEDVLVGGTTPVVIVHGQAEGDLAKLNGKTIYVLVDGPAAILAVPTIQASPDGSFEIGMPGKPVSSPAHITGTLTFHVCLDADGGHEFPGSPFTVPYDVRVASGLTLDEHAAEVDTTFGEGALSHEVVFHANVSPYATEWHAEFYATTDPGSIAPTTVTTAEGGTVTVTLNPKPPGTYTETVRVFARVSHGGVDLALHEDFVVTYVVRENTSIRALFVPSELVGVATFGDNVSVPVPYYVLGNTGVTPSGHTVEYLTHPAAADGHPQVAAWYSAVGGGYLEPCYNTISSSDCLPPGEYTARIPYDMIEDDVTTGTEYLPVKLTIEP